MPLQYGGFHYAFAHFRHDQVQRSHSFLLFEFFSSVSCFAVLLRGRSTFSKRHALQTGASAHLITPLFQNLMLLLPCWFLVLT
jgi:hypothetical protein